MKPQPTPSSSLDRTKKIVSLCLAASIAASTGHAQAPSADSLRKLQDENAALRKRLAELEGKSAPAAPAASPASAKAPAAPAAARLTTDEGNGDTTVSSGSVVTEEEIQEA